MTVNSVRQLAEMSTIYQRLSTGARINSAKDDASGLAISKKIEAMARGLDQGTDNARDMQNLLRTAEGGLSSINDSLQRIRELGVQVSGGTQYYNETELNNIKEHMPDVYAQIVDSSGNQTGVKVASGIYTESDKALVQEEISQLLDHVKTAARNTEFNTMKLLDGSFANKNTASNPSGTGMTITIENTSLDTLGINNFNVTGAFDLSSIDRALEMVTDARSKIGAQQNVLEHTINANETAYINQMQALSRIADADMAKESTRLSTANVLNEARVYMQKNQMGKSGSLLNLLG